MLANDDMHNAAGDTHESAFDYRQLPNDLLNNSWWDAPYIVTYYAAHTTYSFLKEGIGFLDEKYRTIVFNRALKAVEKTASHEARNLSIFRFSRQKATAEIRLLENFRNALRGISDAYLSCSLQEGNRCFFLLALLINNNDSPISRQVALAIIGRNIIEKRVFFQETAEGQTLLHIASQNEIPHIVELLFDKWILTNPSPQESCQLLQRRDNCQRTILDYLVRNRSFKRFSIEFLKSLIRHGSLVDVPTEKDLSPLQMIVKLGVPPSTIQCFLPEAEVGQDRKTLVDYVALSMSAQSIDTKDRQLLARYLIENSLEKSEALLQRAAQKTDYMTCLSLIENGLNPNIQTIEGDNLLHLMVRGLADNKNNGEDRLQCGARILAGILMHYPDFSINALNNQFETPTMLAHRQGNTYIKRCLGDALYHQKNNLSPWKEDSLYSNTEKQMLLLQKAALLSDFKTCRKILHECPDLNINLKTRNGDNLLHLVIRGYASRKGYMERNTGHEVSELDDSIETIDAIVEEGLGFNLHEKNNLDQSALDLSKHFDATYLRRHINSIIEAQKALCCSRSSKLAFKKG